MGRSHSVRLRPRWAVFLILRSVVFLTRGSAVFPATLALAVLRTWVMAVRFPTSGGVGLLHTLATVDPVVFLGTRAAPAALAATLGGMAMAIVGATDTGEIMKSTVTAATAMAAPPPMEAATTSTADTDAFWFATTTEGDSCLRTPLAHAPGCVGQHGREGRFLLRKAPHRKYRSHERRGRALDLRLV
jgi:hypothetical protein